MSSLKLTKRDFRTDEEYEQYKQNMKEQEEMEMKYNIQMISRYRFQGKSPCKLFYQLKKGIPLSVFLKVYPFNELVDCGSGFDLSELTDLERLYSTFEEGDKQLYIDSFHRLQQVINSIRSNKVPGSYGKGFQSWKDQVAANQEIEEVLRNPEPSQREIDRIAYDHYMQTRIPSPPPQEQSQESQQPESLIGKVKNLFGLGGGKGRKTSKKILRRQKISKSRSSSKSKKSQPHSKKSRSYSRSKK
jgi:hypothetical protein